jgi:cholesterol oxidase
MNATHFDAVVVGSGFGGAVTAYRLAEAGLDVCLLERGKIYPPNSFPRSPAKLMRNFWDPSEGLYGMFNVWSFENLETVVASGLGGGSLIYANVLIRKDERWFAKEDLQHGGYEYWPVTRADLDPHYDQVERMLNAQRYPFEHPPYDRTAKTIEFKAAAERLNLEWELPNLAVTFGNPGEAPIPGEPIRESQPNMHGRTRVTCRLCGECDIGCNYGSKNTLDYNYLSEAKRLGAEIRTQCEVRLIAPREREAGGYMIHYVEQDSDEREGERLDTSQLPQITLTADRLVLSAGALGTTFLLLENQDAFPHLSPTLGARFSGNGDLLSFALRSQEKRNGLSVPRVLDPGFGPVITSAIRIPDELDGGGPVRGHYVEDAGYPEHLNWVLEAQDAPGGVKRLVRFARRRIGEKLSGTLQSDLSAELAGLLGNAELTSSSMPLLGMGRDIPDGRMSLSRKGDLEIDWEIGRSKDYFDGLKKTMADIAQELGAEFALNPTFYFNRVITVHPLGGCPMGRDEGEGVVDAHGEVFNYPGLFIADGSVMPGPVGPNPSLTIAALANRFADRIIEEHKRAGSG